MNHGYIYVPNWKTFQHYTDRSTPAWIKSYRKLLSDDNYLGLSHADRGLLHDVWLLCALDGEGRTSANPKLLARRLNVRRVSLDSIVAAGFLRIRPTKRRVTVTRESGESQVRVNRDSPEIPLRVPRDSSEPRSDAPWKQVVSRLATPSPHQPNTLEGEVEEEREGHTHTFGVAAARNDHIVKDLDIDPAVRGEIDRLVSVINDGGKSTGRLVKAARGGATQFMFADARQAITSVDPAPRNPGAYACGIVEKHLEDRRAAS